MPLSGINQPPTTVKPWLAGIWFALCWAVVTLPALAQPRGCYTFLTDSVGCAPFTVRLQNCFTPGLPVAYNFDYARTPGAWGIADIANRGDTSFTYTQAGEYEIAQAPSGQFNQPFIRRVRVFDQNSKPVFRIRQCQQGLQVLVKDTIFSRVRIYVEGSTREEDVPPGGAVVTFPLPLNGGDTVNAVTISVTGLVPGQCGNTSLSREFVVRRRNQALIPLSVFHDRISPDLQRLTVRYASFGGLEIRQSVLEESSGALLTQATFLTDENELINERTIDISGPGRVGALRVELIDQGCQAQAAFSLPLFEPEVTVEPLTFIIRRPTGTAASFRTETLTRNDQVFAQGSLTDQIRDQSPTGCRQEVCYQFSGFAEIAGQDVFYRGPRVCAFTQTSQQAATLGLRASYPTAREDSLIGHMVSNTPLVTLRSSLGSIRPFESPTGYRFALPTPLSPSCAALSGEDSCGILLPDTTFCLFKLEAQGSGPGNATVTWTVPGGNPTIPIYLTVRSADEVIARIGPLSGTSYRDERIYPEPRINYRASTNLVDTFPIAAGFVSNRVFISLPPRVIMPTAFSPNADDINDSLVIRTFGVLDYSLRIVNRSGEIVFMSRRTGEHWDGRHRGVLAPPDVYIAHISGRDEQGRAYQHSGRVMLIR